MSHPPPPPALVVGAGLMGRWHAHALRRLAIPLAGVVDPISRSAQMVAKAGGGCPVFESVHEAIEAGAGRVAHVCTPFSTHVELVTQLLEAGFHVVAEKPLAATAAATEELLDLADRKERLLCPVHQFIFQDGFLECRRRTAEAGRILHIESVAVSAGAAGGDAESAESVMRDILPHPLSVIERLLVDGLDSVEWGDPMGMPGEFHVLGQSGETTLGITISMRGRPTRNTARIISEDGTFHLDLFHGFMVREPPPTGRQAKVARPFTLASRTTARAGVNLVKRAARRESAYPGLRRLLRLFYSATDGVEEPPIRRDETVDVATVRDQFLRQRHSILSPAPGGP